MRVQLEICTSIEYRVLDSIHSSTHARASEGRFSTYQVDLESVDASIHTGSPQAVVDRVLDRSSGTTILRPN